MGVLPVKHVVLVLFLSLLFTAPALADKKGFDHVCRESGAESKITSIHDEPKWTCKDGSTREAVHKSNQDLKDAKRKEGRYKPTKAEEASEWKRANCRDQEMLAVIGAGRNPPITADEVCDLMLAEREAGD